LRDFDRSPGFKPLQQVAGDALVGPEIAAGAMAGGKAKAPGGDPGQVTTPRWRKPESTARKARAANRDPSLEYSRLGQFPPGDWLPDEGRVGKPSRRHVNVLSCAGVPVHLVATAVGAGCGGHSRWSDGPEWPAGRASSQGSSSRPSVRPASKCPSRTAASEPVARLPPASAERPLADGRKRSQRSTIVRPSRPWPRRRRLPLALIIGGSKSLCSPSSSTHRRCG
jgi:hypothetical protein